MPVVQKSGEWQDVIEQAVKNPAVNSTFDVFWQKINDDYKRCNLKMTQRGKYNLIKKKIKQHAQSAPIKEKLLDDLDEKMLKRCPICIASLRPEEAAQGLVWISPCKHVGHKDCFAGAIDVKQECPTCRSKSFIKKDMKDAQVEDLFEKE